MKSLAIAAFAMLTVYVNVHVPGAHAAEAYPSKPIRFIVPYPPGGGTGLIALTGLPHVKSGGLRALATTGPARSKTLPDVPTVAESGLPRYVSTIWLGVFAPAKTPQPIIDRLNAELVKALAAPDVRTSLAKLDWEVVASTPKAFEKVIAEDLLQYGKVVREAGIRAD